MWFPALFRHLPWSTKPGRKARSRGRRGSPRPSSRRPRWLPRLESLEDRIALSTLTVTSAADDGSAGTLRAVLTSAASGDLIRFAHRLDGQTITLTQGQLTVSQS